MHHYELGNLGLEPNQQLYSLISKNRPIYMQYYLVFDIFLVKYDKNHMNTQNPSHTPTKCLKRKNNHGVY